MTYSQTIAEAGKQIAPHGQAWSGIDAASVARMRLQNRFKTGLDIARYTAKIMREDMESMGPVRLKEVEEAQMAMVQLAKDLAARGEIVLSDNKGGDELVY